MKYKSKTNVEVKRRLYYIILYYIIYIYMCVSAK